ncbi:EIF4G3 [Cordylochernes scorpioides]|uniref:EIF4G3 n=1 Tax=Cordylochernes scorpioides TaxID=51811 RepID=A0ABY6KU19_9ARAC|nr:EIF4G3 [Cordylochernes scorpioides]
MNSANNQLQSSPLVIQNASGYPSSLPQQYMIPTHTALEFKAQVANAAYNNKEPEKEQPPPYSPPEYYPTTYTPEEEEFQGVVVAPEAPPTPPQEEELPETPAPSSQEEVVSIPHAEPSPPVVEPSPTPPPPVVEPEPVEEVVEPEPVVEPAPPVEPEPVAPEVVEAPKIQEEAAPPPKRPTPPPVVEPPSQQPPAAPRSPAPKPEEEIEKEEKKVAEKNEENARISAAEEPAPEESPAVQLKYIYEDDQWSPINPGGQKKYGRDFLLKMQYDPVCLKKPDLPMVEIIRDTTVELRTTENAWKPMSRIADGNKTQDEVLDAKIYREVRSILNKLTPEKFDSLLKQLQSVQIDTVERLEGVINLVFEKAVDEPKFAVPYANLCKHLAKIKVKVDDSDNTVNFRKLLLTKCQKEFEKDYKDDEKLAKIQKDSEMSETEEKRQQKKEEYEDQLRKARRRSLGNISWLDLYEVLSLGLIYPPTVQVVSRFIGELYKLGMLTAPIMHDCLKRLLSQQDEDSLECFCHLIHTIGHNLALETKNKPVLQKHGSSMEEYFKTVKAIVTRGEISSRIKFLILDTVEFKDNNYVSTRISTPAQNNPTTIASIHQEAQREALKAQQEIHMPKRQDDRDRKKGKEMLVGAGGRSGSNYQSSEDGWNTTGRSSKKEFGLEPNKKLSKLDAESLQFGRGGSSAHSWSRSTTAKQSDGDKQAAMCTNRYSALASNDMASSDRHRGGQRSAASSRESSRNGARQTAPPGIRKSLSQTSATHEKEQVISVLKTIVKGSHSQKLMPSESPVQEVKAAKKPPVAPSAEAVLQAREDLSEENIEKEVRSMYEEYVSIGNTEVTTTQGCQCYCFLNFTCGTGHDNHGGRSRGDCFYCKYTTCVHVVQAMIIMAMIIMAMIIMAMIIMAMIIMAMIIMAMIIMAMIIMAMIIMLCVTQEVVLSIKEKASPNTIETFLMSMMNLVLDRNDKARDMFGPLVNVLLAQHIISPEVFKKCLSEMVQSSESLAIDYPRIEEYIAQMVVAVFLGSEVPASFLREVCQECLHSRTSSKLVTHLLTLALRQQPALAAERWQSGELQLSDFLPPDVDLHSHIATHVLVTPSCVQSNVTGSAGQPKFIRALTTTILESGITGSGSSCSADMEGLKKRLPILQKYIDHREAAELEALYAIQVLMARLEHPKDLICALFTLLEEEEVVAEDSFYKWKNCSEALDNEGRAMALVSSQRFFQEE